MCFCPTPLQHERATHYDSYLYIARKGHYVLGVDASQTGISQMPEEADRDNLNVDGVVADIVDYELTSDTILFW